MDRARAHLYISGLVQGVWFRAYVQRTATALGITGWIRNLPDSRVEAVMEGQRQAIELAILECKKGPPGSRVEGVDAQWMEPRGEFSSFTIEH